MTRLLAVGAALMVSLAPVGALAHHPSGGGAGAATGGGVPGAFGGAPSSGVSSATTVGGVPEERITFVAQEISGTLGWHKGFGLHVSIPVVVATVADKAPSFHLGSISVGGRGQFLLGASEDGPRVTLGGAVLMPSTWSVSRVAKGTVSVRPAVGLSGEKRFFRFAGEVGVTAGIGHDATSLVDGAAAATVIPVRQLEIGVEARVAVAVAGPLHELDLPLTVDLSLGATLRPTDRLSISAAFGGSPVSGFGRSVHGTLGFGVDFGRLGPEPDHGSCSCDTETPPPIL